MVAVPPSAATALPEPAAALRHHLGLWWQFTRRNIESRHKGSLLGLVWPLLNPLIMLGLYFFVFGVVFNGRFGARPGETRLDFALALFAGLNLLQFFSEVIGLAPRVIVGSPNLVKKVVFPLAVLPASAVGAALFHHLLAMGLVALGAVALGSGLSGWSLLWPLILLPVVLLALGLAWLLAALGVFLRDLAQLTVFFSTVLMYASAVFYPLALVRPTPFWAVLKFNPLLHAVEQTRQVLLWHQPPAGLPLAYLWGCGLAAFFTGRFIFRKFQPHFADVL